MAERKQAKPTTIGELRSSGYRTISVKAEMRKNMIEKIRKGEELFSGIVGYDESVIPQVENAILSGQDVILLGERGQAKSRLIRSLVSLLDEEIPIIAGCEINDDPFEPICKACRDSVDMQGDKVPAQLVATRAPLRREAGDAGHHHRRPHRRSRPHQGGRRPLSLGRADHSLRTYPADESRHFLHQRAPRTWRSASK